MSGNNKQTNHDQAGTQEGIEVSRKGGQLSADYKDDEDSLIKVWEQTGKSRRIAVFLPAG